MYKIEIKKKTKIEFFHIYRRRSFRR